MIAFIEKIFFVSQITGAVAEPEENHPIHPEEPFSKGLTVTQNFEALRITFRLDPRRLNNVLPPDYSTGLFDPQNVGKPLPGLLRVNVTEHGAARFSIRVFMPPPEVDPGMPIENYMGNTEVPFFDLLLAEQLKTFPCPDAQGLLTLMNLSSATGCQAMKELNPCSQKGRGTDATIAHFLDSIHALDHSIGVFGKEYYGGQPFKLGPDSAMRFGLKPRAEHNQEPIEGLGSLAAPAREGLRSLRDAYREGLENFFNHDGRPRKKAVFDFVIQPAKHRTMQGALNTEWDERLSPYSPVGTVEIYPPQARGGQEFITAPNSFGVWNMPKEHEPLGSIGRARRVVYNAHSAERMKHVTSPAAGVQSGQSQITAQHAEEGMGAHEPIVVFFSF